MSDTKPEVLRQLADEYDHVRSHLDLLHRAAADEIMSLRKAIGRYADHWRGHDVAKGGEWWECDTYSCHPGPNPCNCGFDEVEGLMGRPSSSG